MPRKRKSRNHTAHTPPSILVFGLPAGNPFFSLFRTRFETGWWVVEIQFFVTSFSCLFFYFFPYPGNNGLSHRLFVTAGGDGGTAGHRFPRGQTFSWDSGYFFPIPFLSTTTVHFCCRCHRGLCGHNLLAKLLEPGLVFPLADSHQIFPLLL